MAITDFIKDKIKDTWLDEQQRILTATDIKSREEIQKMYTSSTPGSTTDIEGAVKDILTHGTSTTMGTPYPSTNPLAEQMQVQIAKLEDKVEELRDVVVILLEERKGKTKCVTNNDKSG